MVILASISLVTILGVALLGTQNEKLSTETETNAIETEVPNNFRNGNPPGNFTFPEGDFNFTRPDGDFNFTFPENGFNGTIPEGRSNLMPPDDGFQNSTFPFMENLTDKQVATLNEKMQELLESGATQDEIMAAVQDLMEEWGIQGEFG
ncbi:MAG: hypothetical protein IAX21_00735 [Candidatus Bathyarchaeota archaeon]|nr:MAG: hypothetical protein IAX21_00735 [Candidatus Bathyarchaeota archaeon]